MKKITKEVEAFIRENYPNMETRELADKIGMSRSYLAIWACQNGLHKSKEYISRMKSKNSKSWQGTAKYEEFIERARKRIIHDCHCKEVKERQSEVRRSIVERERARLRLGMKPATRIRIVNAYGGQKYVKTKRNKERLLERGYRADGGRTFVYDDRTDRTQKEPYLSKTYGFVFVAATQEGSNAKKEAVMVPDWRDRQGGFNV